MRTCPVCRRRHQRKSAYCSVPWYRRAKYLAHRADALAYQQAWRAAHPDQVLAQRADRGARERAAAKDKARRAARRAEMALLRPRCAVCPNPLPWHKPSFPLSATTCSAPCARKRWVWFGAQRPRKAA